MDAIEAERRRTRDDIDICRKALYDALFPAIGPDHAEQVTDAIDALISAWLDLKD